MKTRTLVGRIFGDIEAIEYIGNKQYKCKCVKCAHITKQFSSNLKGTLSCKKCGKGYKIDLTGQHYGDLEVKGYNKDTKQWICQCKCGRIVEVRSNNLKSGNTKTCGICGNLECVHRSIVEGTRISQLNIIQKNNKSGKTGVYYKASRHKWCASIRFQGVNYWLGYHAYLQDAIDAREEAERNLHGEFLKWYNSTKTAITKSEEEG